MKRLNSETLESQKALFNIPWDGESFEIATASFQEVLSWYVDPGQDPEILVLAKEVLSKGELFLSRFYTQAGCVRKEGLQDFHDACKAKDDDLEMLVSHLNMLDETFNLAIVFGDKLTVSPQHWTRVASVVALHLDDEELDKVVYELLVPPKWYSPLYIGIFRCMELACRFKGEDATKYRICVDLSLTLRSLARLYKEFRSTTKMKLERERSALKSFLSQDHSLDKDSKYYQVFLEVIEDIKEGKHPYVREMANAIASARDYIQSSFSDNDFYFSGRGTSTSVKGMQRQKSIFASTYEDDPFRGHKFDSDTGYQSAYNQKGPPGYDGLKCYTVGINQHQLKERLIHIFMNSIQDRGRYIEQRVLAVLNRLPNDFTKKHRGCLNSLMKWTNPVWREGSNWPSVQAVDYSNMTDTLNQEFQLMCLRIIPFNPGVFEFYEDVLHLEREFKLSDRSKVVYHQSCGQPQGFLPSFATFTFAHHILRLIILKALSIEELRASSCYCLIGDDNAATSVYYDPENLFEKVTREVSAWVNIEISAKSTFIDSSNRDATLTMASVSVSNGAIMTPIPIRLLTRCASRQANYYSFTTALWMVETGFIGPSIIDHLLRKWYGSNAEIFRFAQLMIYGGVIPAFSQIARPNLFDENERKIGSFCYLITKLRGTFVECFLNDKQREMLLANEFTLHDGIESLLPKFDSANLDRIEDQDHKFLKALSWNIAIEDAMKSILGLDEARYYLPVLGKLTEEEISCIFDISEIVESVLEGQISKFSVTQIMSNIGVVGFLDRFQMRSFHKRRAREFYFLREVITLYERLFLLSEENTEVQDQSPGI